MRNNTEHSVAEAAAKVGLGDFTLRRHMKSGSLKFSKRGGRIWISDADLKAYAKQLALPEMQRLGRLTLLFTNDQEAA